MKKHLGQAINVALFEKNNPEIEINDNVFTQCEIESESNPYETFRPLALGNVSKASTAQYLAQILDNNKVSVIEVIKIDPYLKYIVDAICHVTEPLTTEQHE